jgi:hypothetical protein
VQAQRRCGHVQEIEIRTSDQDITTQAATLAHEIAQSLLHWTADGHKITTREGKPIDKQIRELEADSVAFVVCNFFGIQSPSDFYLATYDVTPALLLEAVETIAKTVKTILEGCQQAKQPPESEPVTAVLEPALVA